MSWDSILFVLSPLQVLNIKKAIKASSSSQDIDDQHMQADTREMEVQAIKPVKKSSKIKG